MHSTCQNSNATYVLFFPQVSCSRKVYVIDIHGIHAGKSMLDCLNPLLRLTNPMIVMLIPMQ